MSIGFAVGIIRDPDKLPKKPHVIAAAPAFGGGFASSTLTSDELVIPFTNPDNFWEFEIRVGSTAGGSQYYLVDVSVAVPNYTVVVPLDGSTIHIQVRYRQIGSGVGFSSAGAIATQVTAKLAEVSALTATVTQSSKTSTSINIQWSITDANSSPIPATGQIFYGLAANALTQSTGKENTFTYSTHAQTITGLTADTLYYFEVRGNDSTGAPYVGAGSFTTLAGVVVNTSALYVALTGSDGNAGTTTGAPLRNIQTAINAAQAGTTIYVKAGNYGAVQISSARAGTSGAPIVIEGYKTTPGDRPKLTGSQFDVNTATADPAQMPLLRWSTRSDATFRVGINITHANVHAHSMQVEYHTTGISIGSGATGHVGSGLYVFNTGDISSTNGYYRGTAIQTGAAGTIWDSIGQTNATGEGITLTGNNCTLTNSKSFCNDNQEVQWPTGGAGGTDYYILVNGNNCVVRGCLTEQSDAQNVNHVGHGIKCRGSDNLVEDSITYNMGDSLVAEFRNGFGAAARNTFRNCTAYGRSAVGGKSHVGINVIGNAPDTRFDNCTVTQLAGSATMYGMFFIAENDGANGGQAGGNGTIVENCTINNCGINFSCRISGGETYGATIRNNTFNGGTYLFQMDHNFRNSKFYGNTINGVSNLSSSGMTKFALRRTSGDYATSGTADTNVYIGVGYTLP